MIELRPYQMNAIVNLRDSLARGKKAPLLVMPTGSGKTKTSAFMIRSATSKGKSVLFIAPRRQLVMQTSAELNNFDVLHGIIMAGEPPLRVPQVQVASIDTLHRRALPRADLIIIDEAHTVMGEKARKVFEGYPDAIKIGLTATPARADGRGLSEVYDDLVLGPSPAELIAMGNLVQPKYFGCPKEMDLSGVKLTGGDYNQGELDAYMSQPELVGDVVTNWMRICPDRSTVVACVKRTHARAVKAEFLKHGIRADYIDGETHDEERKAIFRRIESTETQVLVSVDVVSYGVDVPRWSCAVIARPTKSITRYLQFCGRVLRPHPESGKTDCIIIDHGQCVGEDRLGFLEDERPWSLDSKTSLRQREEKLKKKPKKPKTVTCRECLNVQDPAKTCRQCGADLSAKFAEAMAAYDVALEEVKRGKAQGKAQAQTEMQVFFSELLKVAAEWNYKPGWASNQFRNKFQIWPNGLGDIPASRIRKETRQWVKGQQIRYIKSLEKKRAA